MRVKDEGKRDRIYKAAIQVVNESGFQGASMAKIARQAGIAPATIYLYFENKDDMINKLYLQQNLLLSQALYRSLDDSLPVKEALETIWRAFYAYLMNNHDECRFLDQFCTSPLIDKLSQEAGKSYYATSKKLYERGRQEGVLKQLADELITAHFYLPIAHLATMQMKGDFQMTEAELAEAFAATWDAISSH